MSQGEEAITLYPLEAFDGPSLNVLTQINETLFKVNDREENEPWLAEAAEQSDGGRVWTLRLRRGVKFSNGKPLTAADVLYTLEAAKKSAAWGGPFEGVESFAAPRPNIVTIKSSEPAPEIPALLSQYSFAIVPDGLGGMSPKEFGQHPIGTGPFTLSNWRHGESITLVKNPHYWEHNRPYLDKIVFQSVPSPESRVAQLKGGQLDMIYQPPWSQVDAIANTPGLTVPESPLGFLQDIILNAHKGLFADRKAREAVNLAIDREGIVSAVLGGRGEPAGSWLPPVVPFADASIEAPRQNPAKAKELVEEAVEEGANPTFVLSTISEDPFWSTAIQIVQQNLEEVGFSVQIRQSDFSAYLEALAAGKFDVGANYGYWATPSPLEGIASYNATEGIYSGAPTKETSRLTAAALSEPNVQKRGAFWHRTQQIISEGKFILPVAYMPFVWAFHSELKGFYVNSAGVPWFGDAGLAK